MCIYVDVLLTPIVMARSEGADFRVRILVTLHSRGTTIVGSCLKVGTMADDCIWSLI